MESGLVERAPKLGVADAIQYLRTKRDLTRQALGLEAGLSQSYVGKVERGETQPSLRAFASLAVALGMKPEEAWVVIVAEAAEAARESRTHRSGVTPHPYPPVTS